MALDGVDALFGVSINVWSLGGGSTLNIACNFLYCNHQVHRDFLITLYAHSVSFLSSDYQVGIYSGYAYYMSIPL
jgi:hypothetical protein